MLPVKQFLLPDDRVSEPIPTLSDRQFVVTKSNLSSAEEKNQRELFWYREELLKLIRGHWQEVTEHFVRHSWSLNHFLRREVQGPENYPFGNSG